MLADEPSLIPDSYFPTYRVVELASAEPLMVTNCTVLQKPTAVQQLVGSSVLCIVCVPGSLSRDSMPE